MKNDDEGMTNKNEIASSKGCGIKNVYMSEPTPFQTLSHFYIYYHVSKMKASWT